MTKNDALLIAITGLVCLCVSEQYSTPRRLRQPLRDLGTRLMDTPIPVSSFTLQLWREVRDAIHATRP